MIFVDNENTKEKVEIDSGLIVIDNSNNDDKSIYLICSSRDDVSDIGNCVYKIVDLNKSQVLLSIFETPIEAYDYIMSTLVNKHYVMIFNKGDLILTRNK